MKRVKATNPEMQNRKKLILGGVIIYLVVLALAITASFYIAASSNDRMELILQDEAAHYVSTGYLRLDTSEASKNIVAVYNLRGERVATRNPQMYTFDFDSLFAPLVKESFKDGYITKIGLNAEIDRLFYCASATQVVLGETTIGVICQLREQQSLLGWIISAFVMVTTIAVSALVCVLFEFKYSDENRRLRDSYIANVSHSLKSPLASIRALAEPISEGMVTDIDKIQNFNDLILSETAFLEKTVSEMLELSRMQNKKSDFTKQWYSAQSIFSPAISKYSILCDDMGITFHSPDLQNVPNMWTNKLRIETLLEVLLDNALKFVKDNGDIWLMVTQSSDMITVCVQDNGIGIDKELQPHVFERFFKGDTNNERGSGLGLSIARQIAMGLDEKIWFQSKPGEGTSFFFTIHIYPSGKS